jgi:uncharacterized metal-binding protein
MANHFALRLDREGLAEMSCIAGVGGGVPALVRTARKPRAILALDGCPLHCVLACLNQAGIEATSCVDLSLSGVRKLKKSDFSRAEAERVWHESILPAVQALSGDIGNGLSRPLEHRPGDGCVADLPARHALSARRAGPL